MTPETEIAHALRLLVGDNVTEVRILGVAHRGTISGYYDAAHLDTLASHVLRYDGTAEGVYIVLNPVRPELLARAKNRLQERPKNTTNDSDVSNRVWLFIDCDPCRSKGIPSTDAEHDAAISKARAIRDYLTNQEWPQPILADSGNGAHLLYPIDLPNDESSRELCRDVIQAIRTRFNDAIVEIDDKTFNAERICKLYGTVAAKGEDSPELGRPHRRSCLLDVPEKIEIVTPEQLGVLADQHRQATTRVTTPQPPTAKQTPAGSVADLSDDELLKIAFASKQGDKFQRLWGGDNSDYDGDESDGDAAFRQIAAFWTGRDATRIERWWQQSERWNRPKVTDRPDYVRRTIENEIGRCREVFQPRNESTFYPPRVAHDGGNDSSSPWPSPLAPAALHGFIGDMVRVISPHTEADPAALVFQFLAAFGNCIGRNPYYQVEASKHRANLFVCIVGRSAKSRKGTSWDRIKSLFEVACPSWVEERIKSGLSSGEGLINEVRDQDGNEDKRLLSVESEFATVLRSIEREGNTVSARIRDAFDGGRLYTLTKQNPLKATGAHISIVGHCTAEELRRYLTRTELGNGFANRFMWVCAKRSQLLPDGGNLGDYELKPLTDRLQEAVTFATYAEEVRRDSGARELWHEVYRHLSRETPGLLGSVISRAEAQVTRLALLYALLDMSSVIRREHLQAALAVWQYAEASARYIFGDSTGDDVADTLLAFLKSNPQGVDKQILHRQFHNNLPAARLNRALTLLESSGRVRCVPQPSASGKGRPAEIWQIAPPQSGR
jgi:hypothetical protein